jgi:primase-polymerase (primpol)-like protein
MINPTPADYQRVPDTMRHPTLKRWVVFRCIPQLDGTVKKTPLHPIGFGASISDSRTWSNFHDCITAMGFQIGNAVGFALGSDYKMLVIDFDKCIDDTGKVSEKALWYLNKLASADPYVERSISGRGLHALVWYSGKRLHLTPEPGVEMYSDGQFVVMTGVPL